ncbi:MAG TPA: hypothetical protein VHQ90_20165 [Thermoanaerobaculia bacterium]|nr:hypothetical protein [Thermoanaerobaculia bacterium]
MRARYFLTAALVLAATRAGAQTGQVDPNCVPTEKNGRVVATGLTLTTGQTPRLYFRWFEDKVRPQDQKPFYWVEMEVAPNGRFWAIPPKPEKRNQLIEYYVAIASPDGRTVSRIDPKKVKVTGDCKPNLDVIELGVSSNLTIGETAPDQEKKKVYGFLCDGIVTRINSKGIRRADETCRTCVVAWWADPGILVPAAGVAAAGGLAGFIISDQPEPTQSRPPL